jgi:divalent metal cation (Fe/Co/Zn/Cd) transporter
LAYFKGTVDKQFSLLLNPFNYKDFYIEVVSLGIYIYYKVFGKILNMETISENLIVEKESLYKWAYTLALITIFYNIVEGVISVLFSLEDETIALFGFGFDSFVEVISGIGIWHMIKRLKQSTDANPDRFEKQALRITGTAFYILTVGLFVTAIINLYREHTPESTFWGIIIASISILTMWLLIHYKLKVGKKLNSQSIIADANCTRACMYLSMVLLLSSAGYELFKIGGIDSMGAVIIAFLSLKEGREAFEKARSNFVCSCSSSCDR